MKEAIQNICFTLAFIAFVVFLRWVFDTPIQAALNHPMSTLTFFLSSAGIAVSTFIITAVKFPDSRISCDYSSKSRYWWRSCVGLILILFFYWLIFGMTPSSMENYSPQG